MKRHKTFYIDKINEIEYCGSNIYQLIGGEFEFPFKINATTTTHNLETCDECNKFHKELIKEFSIRAKKFPKCCPLHSKLFELKEFSLGNYTEVAKWSADKIIFSIHHYIRNMLLYHICIYPCSSCTSRRFRE